jgi:hypothetical protein
MTMRKGWLAVMSLTVAAAIAPAISFSAVYLDVDIAPPAPRVEVVPAPRAGYVWAPGYWDWRGHNHVWVEGRWLGERHGYHWEPDHWVQRGPHWHHEPGRWVR